jgi:hypothetical protein
MDRKRGVIAGVFTRQDGPGLTTPADIGTAPASRRYGVLAQAIPIARRSDFFRAATTSLVGTITASSPLPAVSRSIPRAPAADVAAVAES